MLLTEDEARKQTCPLITFVVNEDDVLQRGAQPLHVHQNCKASECGMGWRWATLERPVYLVRIPGDAKYDTESEWRWNPHAPQFGKKYADYIVRILKAERAGYCGAFGRPE